jgi:ABC-type branched-subunit amino acid transport system substrate-binding protein
LSAVVRLGGGVFSRLLAAGAVSMSLAACRASRPILHPPERGGAPVTIGVALPLSGRLKAFGEGGRDAARLAAGELQRKADHRIRVAVRDTKGDAAGAEKAVEELVLEEGAIAIVGPLFRAEAGAAAEKAQDLGVPLIALTSDREVTGAGAYVFHAGLSPEDEMDALVAYVMDELHLTSFAVLHPRIEYGERMLQLFRERVEERGGTLQAIESYAAEDTTFTEQIERLVHRDEPTKREDYLSAIAKCKDARDSFRKARCEREARENIPPIIEFQALFIPDGYERIALIAPAVAAEDVIVERDPDELSKIEKTLGYQVQPITLLGTSAWNSPDLPQKAGRTVENALFADASFDAASDAATTEFSAAFRKHFGRRPERPEALIYDATRFLREVLAAERPTTTDDLRAKMHDVPRFEGVTGELSFHDGTEGRRILKILTIEDQAIREVKRGER